MKKVLLAFMGAFLVSALIMAQGTCNITLKVNMQYAVDAGIFSPDNDYVDVAGTFNGWDGSNHKLTAEGSNVYSITISDIAVGSVQEFKFRINGSWSDDKHEFPAGGPNRKLIAYDGLTVTKVFNNKRPGWVPVNLSVNMSVWASKGKFVKETQFVDVAGNFNDWSGSDQLFDDNNDLIYSATVLAQAGQNMAYKCRIDGSWDDAKHEFPGGAPAREYMVLDTAGGVVNEIPVFYFNDEQPTTSVLSLSASNLSIYPNPASNIINIKADNNLDKVIVSDLSGRQVIVRYANSNCMQIAVNELNKGTYFVTVFYSNGTKNTQKVVIY